MELLFSRIYILQVRSKAIRVLRFVYVYISRFSYFTCLNCFFLVKEIAYRKYWWIIKYTYTHRFFLLNLHNLYFYPYNYCVEILK